jgi:hypothetical protein
LPVVVLGKVATTSTISLVVRALGDEIVPAYAVAQKQTLPREALSFFLREIIDVDFIVVGVVPNSSRRVCGRVDEELMRLLWVKRPYPSFR